MCKHLRNIAPTLTTRKKIAEQSENQWLFLNPSENWGHATNHHPENWGGRLIQRIYTNLPEHKSQEPGTDRSI